MYYIVITAFVGGMPIHQHVEPDRYRTQAECREAIPDVARSGRFVPPTNASYGFACIKIDEEARQ